MLRYFIFLIIAAMVAAEDKWAWSSSDRKRDNKAISSTEKRYGRLENLENEGLDRFEPTTAKPPNDFFGPAGGIGNPNANRFNYNAFNGNGLGSGIGPGSGFGLGSGFGPGVGPGINSGIGPGIGSGIGPGISPGVGAYPRPVGAYGNNFIPNNYNGIYPNAGAHPGVLVGPGGPSGVIGRPNGVIGNPNGIIPQRGYTGSGILVGPGGPTGIVGRPNGYGGYGGVGRPGYGYGSTGGYGGPGLVIPNRIPGASYGGAGPFGSGPFTPYNNGGSFADESSEEKPEKAVSRKAE